MWKIFKHLAPRSKLWRIPYGTNIYRFFQGLGGSVVDDPIEKTDEMFLDAFPGTTREIPSWEEQFALTPNSLLSDTENRDRLAATWKAQGGQTIPYINSVLQDAGFPLYVHSWETGGGGTYIPSAVLGAVSAYTLLVNKMYEISIDYTCEAGEAVAEAGEARAEAGDNDGVNYDRVVYDIPTNTREWRHFLYIGSQTFLSSVSIPIGRKDELEDLCLRLCPTHRWIALCADYGV